ncbi:SRPBCC domain-containing protein [Angustibacter sp. McL0619]|uniref:SRPBCC domain-containing protein n=1 Tax=Angustibacter sp. McL0619 TaxID=3415676 RepID=UPI003CEE0BDD
MTIAPVRREIRVAADPATAYAVFTAHLGSWWPLGQFSVHGATASVAFEGDEIVERSTDGQVSIWAEVLERSAPDLLRLAWHPGQGSDQATELEVTFRADGDATVVRLLHTGWERLAEPQRAADSYAHGWVAVVDCYGDRVGTGDGQADGAPAEEWFVLEHRPGPAAQVGTPLFQQPLFAEHIAFLGRLADGGLLVAAGPLPDEVGSGMAVVRVPARASGVDVRTLATTDDLSVKGELLTVAVRPWRVQLTG